VPNLLGAKNLVEPAASAALRTVAAADPCLVNSKPDRAPLGRKARAFIMTAAAQARRMLNPRWKTLPSGGTGDADKGHHAETAQPGSDSRTAAVSPELGPSFEPTTALLSALSDPVGPGRLLDTIKSRLPGLFRRIIRLLKRQVNWAINARRPVDVVFNDVYATKQWGSGAGFHSGPGSIGTPAEQYAEYIRMFIRRHDIRSVVDLGCGDFQVAQGFAGDDVAYLGVDVVESLIEYNQATFGSDRRRFVRLDVTRDPLPDGDLCLIREVLQHLSNKQISQVLRAARKYRYVIYSDYQPSGATRWRPNRDIVHGRDTRIWKNSGVALDHAPFNRRMQLLLEVPSQGILRRPGECIRTFLLTDQGAPSGNRDQSGHSLAGAGENEGVGVRGAADQVA
jgi:SAM-dependent methyltransferase